MGCASWTSPPGSWGSCAALGPGRISLCATEERADYWNEDPITDRIANPHRHSRGATSPRKSRSPQSIGL